MIKYNYANNLSDGERHDIWNKLNYEGEIEYVFSYTERFANLLSDPAKTREVNREDRLELEKWYAKCEIALSKMEDNVRYSKEIRDQYLERYNKCIEFSGHINQRSIAD
ncbi:hypothetical protein Elgi_37040 [Paenibacillus elgii]|uniref:hypothetical protein n=1 Tax=Paenibacillus elgii TaxID=189691 RepID=UPI002D7C748A|nr:hypothetical protein Elgi_37040 [Paenibacillus elgii]